MRTVVVCWYGDFAQAQALIEAIAHNCGCEGKQPGMCSAHQAMLSQRFLDGLLWGRHMRERLLAEEHR